MFGRRILMTTLDPIPRAFRCAPGVVALNAQELQAIEQGDKSVPGPIVEALQADDIAYSLRAYVVRPVKRAQGKISPGARMALANAILGRRMP